MKNRIIRDIIVFAVSLLAPQIMQAQGTTYLSNLEQPSIGSITVGNDSWYASLFQTGNNGGGYVLNAIQLAMANATGSPGGFTVMLYANNSPDDFYPGNNIGTLNGSLNPVNEGVYIYTPPSNLVLSPSSYYYIVLTSGTTVANGAYDWGLAGANSYNPNGGWGGVTGVWNSNNGSLWNSPRMVKIFIRGNKPARG
jgi:hypothetical protein